MYLKKEIFNITKFFLTAALEVYPCVTVITSIYNVKRIIVILLHLTTVTDHDSIFIPLDRH